MSKQFFKDKDSVDEPRPAREAEVPRKAWLMSPMLSDGEVEVWRGRPKRGIAFGVFPQWDRIFWLLFLSWCAYDVYKLLGLVARRPNTLDWLLAFLPLLMAIGYFITGALVRSRRVYVVTNKRVMQIDSLLRRRTRSVELKPGVRIDIFGELNDRASISVGHDVGGVWIFRIKNASPVADLIRRQATELGPASHAT